MAAEDELGGLMSGAAAVDSAATSLFPLAAAARHLRGVVLVGCGGHHL
jgi:hypothetical protein